MHALEVLAAFLALYGEWFWEARLKDDLRLLRTGGPRGLKASLADVDEDGGDRLAELFIGPANGHRVRSDEVTEGNQRLSNLRTEVRCRALALKDAFKGPEPTGERA